MIIYTVYYDIENNGNGILGTYSTKKESINAIVKECFKENLNISKEEFENNINKNNGYEWDKGYYQIESKEMNLELYIILYEDFQYGFASVLGSTKSEEGAIIFILNDIKNNKNIKNNNIKKSLTEYKEYSNSDWCYKILKNNVFHKQEVYSCKEYYIIKDFETNKLSAYENNGIFIYSSSLELNKFKSLIENILKNGYSI